MGESVCPPGLWFANQTHQYACATLALLNVVMNIPNAKLGAELQKLKDFTQPFPPRFRGDRRGGPSLWRTALSSSRGRNTPPPARQTRRVATPRVGAAPNRSGGIVATVRIARLLLSGRGETS